MTDYTWIAILFLGTAAPIGIYINFKLLERDLSKSKDALSKTKDRNCLT